MSKVNPTKIQTVRLPNCSCSEVRFGVGVGGSSANTTVMVGEGVGGGARVGDGVPVGVAGSGVNVTVEVGDGMLVGVAGSGIRVAKVGEDVVVGAAVTVGDTRVAVPVGVLVDADGVAIGVGAWVAVCRGVGVALPCAAGAEADSLCQAAAPHTASVAPRKQIVRSSVCRCLTGTALSCGERSLYPSLVGWQIEPQTSRRTLHWARGGCIMRQVRHIAGARHGYPVRR
jgi:hypothetical protein